MTTSSRRFALLVLAAVGGCTSPLTVAEPRDAGDAGIEPQQPVLSDAGPAFEASDAADEPPELSDPPEDAGPG